MFNKGDRVYSVKGKWKGTVIASNKYLCRVQTTENKDETASNEDLILLENYEVGDTVCITVPPHIHIDEKDTFLEYVGREAHIIRKYKDDWYKIDIYPYAILHAPILKRMKEKNIQLEEDEVINIFGGD